MLRGSQDALHHRGVVVAPRILLGSQRTPFDAAFIRRHGVTHCLCCAAELPIQSPATTAHLHRAAISESMCADSAWRLFADAVEWGTMALASQGTLLVYCKQGWNRSAAVVAGILMQQQRDLSPDAALVVVRAAQRKAAPKAPMFAVLKRLSSTSHAIDDACCHAMPKVFSMPELVVAILAALVRAWPYTASTAEPVEREAFSSFRYGPPVMGPCDEPVHSTYELYRKLARELCAARRTLLSAALVCREWHRELSLRLVENGLSLRRARDGVRRERSALDRSKVEYVMRAELM